MDILEKIVIALNEAKEVAKVFGNIDFHDGSSVNVWGKDGDLSKLKSKKGVKVSFVEQPDSDEDNRRDYLEVRFTDGSSVDVRKTGDVNKIIDSL